MTDYHDREWGRAIVGDDAVFERLMLEAMQSGLSWLIVLRKREGMRSAYAGFDLATLADWTEADVERVLADPGVIRNRAKVTSVVTNARVALDLPGGLAAYVESHAAPPASRPRNMSELRSTSPESVAMAKDLRKRGMRFVGPTTLHSLLQAGGWAENHLADCEF